VGGVAVLLSRRPHLRVMAHPLPGTRR
jgi:hypothetical protein